MVARPSESVPQHLWQLLEPVVTAAKSFALNPNPGGINGQPSAMRRIGSDVSLDKFRTNLGFCTGLVGRCAHYCDCSPAHHDFASILVSGTNTLWCHYPILCCVLRFCAATSFQSKDAISKCLHVPRRHARSVYGDTSTLSFRRCPISCLLLLYVIQICS
jgi:hypothetical protein